jgi:hypothetical protein
VGGVVDDLVEGQQREVDRRRPVMAAPTPMPTIVFSEIGVSRTRFSPNSSSSPAVTLKAPLKTPMSSPMSMTFSSRTISSRSASLSASR